MLYLATGDLVIDNTAPYPLHDPWCVNHAGDKGKGPGPRLARVPLVRVGIVLHAHAEPERAANKQAGGADAAASGTVEPVGPEMQPLRLEKTLTVAEAEKLAGANHDLSLFGLSSLSADVAGPASLAWLDSMTA